MRKVGAAFEEHSGASSRAGLRVRWLYPGLACASVLWFVLLSKHLRFLTPCGLSLTAGLPAASAIRSLVPLLRSRTPSALAVLCIGWYLASAGVLLAGSEGQRTFSEREVAELLKSVAAPGSPDAGIAGMAKFAARWPDLGDANAIMRVHTHDLLAAQGLPMREMGRIHQQVVVSRR